MSEEAKDYDSDTEFDRPKDGKHFYILNIKLLT